MCVCMCVCCTRDSVCGCVVGVGRCLFAVCAMSFLNEKCVLTILNAYLLYESKMSLFGFHSCLISLI
jgi:hypothetical protein